MHMSYGRCCGLCAGLWKQSQLIALYSYHVVPFSTYSGCNKWVLGI